MDNWLNVMLNYILPLLDLFLWMELISSQTGELSEVIVSAYIYV